MICQTVDSFGQSTPSFVCSTHSFGQSIPSFVHLILSFGQSVHSFGQATPSFGHSRRHEESFFLNSSQTELNFCCYRSPLFTVSANAWRSSRCIRSEFVTCIGVEFEPRGSVLALVFFVTVESVELSSVVFTLSCDEWLANELIQYKQRKTSLVLLLVWYRVRLNTWCA